jgi:hypothetical protein
MCPPFQTIQADSGKRGLKDHELTASSIPAFSAGGQSLKSNHLLVNGGSDCHGNFVARKLGNPAFTSDDISFEAFSKLEVAKSQIPETVS